MLCWMNKLARAVTIFLISVVSLTFGTKSVAAANPGQLNAKRFFSYALQPDSAQLTDSSSRTAQPPTLGAGGNRLSL